MSQSASGDDRAAAKHAAGGRRAAGRGSGSDPGRRSGDSSAPEVTDSGDELGIASWLESAGPVPHETGPLLPELGPSAAEPSQTPDPDDDDPLGLGTPGADAGATRAVSKHAAPRRRANPVAEPTAEPQIARAFAPDHAPGHTADPGHTGDPDELPARTGGGTRGQSPSTRPRRTGGGPPGQATGGVLAAALIVAAIVGFAGGAWFGSREDGGSPSADSRTTAPGTTAPGDPEPPAEGLTVAADPTTVAPNELIAISGTLTPAEAGVEVSVQRRVGDGEWEDFPNSDRPITLTTRADGTFSGSVATGEAGANAFRVVNVDDPEMASSEVAITVEE